MYETFNGVADEIKSRSPVHCRCHFKELKSMSKIKCPANAPPGMRCYFRSISRLNYNKFKLILFNYSSFIPSKLNQTKMYILQSSMGGSPRDVSEELVT